MAFDSLGFDSSTSPPARHRSILSKFTNRFSNRNRNISEFYIQPDDPWKTYSPGDVVNGAVIITVVKPVRITHLVVCLHGYAKVFKNPVASGENAEDSGFLGPGRGRRDGEYLGNGFASLFEDEVVLCGDGRLKEGVYKFRFELLFPPYNLPSSINFERGSISYMVTSTLTRPTTISPAMSCDKRIILLETIDIAPLPIPKPRVVSLERISKRSKTKSKTKSTSDEQISNEGGVSLSIDPSSHNSETKPPLSPVPSEQSNSSCVSNSTQSFHIISDSNSAQCTTNTRGDENQGDSGETITATTKLLRPGGLPGDILPLKISVKHTRPIRSSNGIIITFYRQGRIDMYPAIPIGKPEKGKKPVYEDYYPKSRTGLGGLSFGANRTCSVFRKDLSQNFYPLVVDPTTMTAELKTSIRIPEDCFPTITRVPGAMISFRYYVEVVMDLRGKLAGQDRFLPRLNKMSASNQNRAHNMSDNPRGSAPFTTSNSAAEILDTDQLRREKSVVACLFEVIVGSKDSARGQRQQPRNGISTSEQNIQPQDDTRQHHNQQQHSSQTHLRFAGRMIPPQDEYDTNEHGTWDTHPPDQYTPIASPPPQFLPPAQPEEVVDEKTRLRRAEEMLLPSAPPQNDDANSEGGPSLVPSAPILFDHDNPSSSQHPPIFSHVPLDYVHSPSYSRFAPAPSTDTITPYTGNSNSLSMNHAGPFNNSSSLHGGAPEEYQQRQAHEDDKQELERQRLLNEASSPSELEPPDMREPDRSPTAIASMEHGEHSQTPHPSAPMLTEEDIVGQPMVGGESLPRYQRWH